MAVNTVPINTYLLTFGHGTMLVVKPSKISEIWDIEMFSGKIQSTQNQI